MNEPAGQAEWAPRRLLGRTGDVLAFLWGLAEGSVFFLVPDILLTLSAAFSPRRGLRQLAFAITGSIVAGLALFAWAVRDPAQARRTVESVPFVQASMFDRVEGDFERAGAWALCLGPTSGIPYKVYAVAAPAHTSAVAFGLVSVPARAERLLITWAQFAIVGLCLRRWSSRPVRWAFVVHAVYWIVVYTLYWSRVGGGG